MAQFDIHRYPSATRTRYVVDVQSDLLQDLATRLVVPVYPVTEEVRLISRLNPTVDIEGRRHFLATQEMTAVRKVSLGEKIRSMADERDAVIAAVDLLVTGI
jgi:toxin CcdB